MNKGYINLFRGFLLIVLDFNIGSFDILPDFIGYLLILVGLSYLYSKTDIKIFNFAKAFSLCLLINEGLNIATGTVGVIQFTKITEYALMLFGALNYLLLTVFIYSGMTKHMNDIGEEVLSKRFFFETRIYAVLQGLCLIAISFSLNMKTEGDEIYTYSILIVSIIMYIRMLINLHSAKKVFEYGIPERIESV